MIPSTPHGMAASISMAVKAVMLAVIAFGMLPINGDQVAAIAIAVAALADLAIYFGILRPNAASGGAQDASGADPITVEGDSVDLSAIRHQTEACPPSCD